MFDLILDSVEDFHTVEERRLHRIFCGLLNVHSLRHTNASLLIANGTDVATVAGLLGHSQPSTTLDIYTHAFDKNKKAASEVLQKGLEI